MNNNYAANLPEALVEQLVANTLAEDLGRSGDITSNSIFAPSTKGKATIVSRSKGVLAGAPFADKAFTKLDTTAKITWFKNDGDTLNPGDKLAEINAAIRAILGAERTALNFLGHLSGIASLTQSFAAKVKGTNATITDTRKTTPGLRSAEKYAVRLGGGANHRFGLDDAVLIKDNHIAYAGGVKKAIQRTKSELGHMVKIEVEVDNLNQLEECLNEKIDAVLLDNMTPDQLKKAVALIDNRLISEASGSVTLESVAAIAETGVDIISIGALTHSANSLDLGLDVDIPND